MARNGLKAVEENTRDEVYDGLSPDGQDDWDVIGSHGYRPERQVATGLWFARKNGGTDKDAIGPSESLSVLKTMVVQFAEDQVAADADNPSSRLPGMEEPAIEELDRQADICNDLYVKARDAKALSTDADERMKDLMVKHGRKRYARGEWNLVAEDNIRLTHKKAQKDPKDKANKKAA